MHPITARHGSTTAFIKATGLMEKKKERRRYIAAKLQSAYQLRNSARCGARQERAKLGGAYVRSQQRRVAVLKGRIPALCSLRRETQKAKVTRFGLPDSMNIHSHQRRSLCSNRQRPPPEWWRRRLATAG
ncbi:hypothetical protein MRX96_032225 [Rhipicephalus microplus]